MPLIQWIMQNLQVAGPGPGPGPMPFLTGGDDAPPSAGTAVKVDLSARLAITIELKVVTLVGIKLSVEPR